MIKFCSEYDCPSCRDINNEMIEEKELIVTLSCPELKEYKHIRCIQVCIISSFERLKFDKKWELKQGMQKNNRFFLKIRCF